MRRLLSFFSVVTVFLGILVSPSSAAISGGTNWIVNADTTNPGACLEGEGASLYVYKFGYGNFFTDAVWTAISGDLTSVALTVEVPTNGFGGTMPYYFWVFNYFEGDCPAPSDNWVTWFAGIQVIGDFTEQCVSPSTVLSGAATTPADLRKLLGYFGSTFGIISEFGTATSPVTYPGPSGDATWTFTIDTDSCPLPEPEPEPEQESGPRVPIDFRLPDEVASLPDTL